MASTGSTGSGKVRRFLIFGVPVMGAFVFFIAGIIFWGGFNTVMEATNTLEFCTTCHEMEQNVYKEYKHTVHAQSRTGVGAICSDCHVPKDWTHKMIRKIQASNEVFHWIMGTINTPEKFNAKRLTLAKHVWKTMKETDSRECRNCHSFEAMNPRFQRPRARKQHLNAMKTGQTCIDCHKGIAHTNVRDKLTEEELEALEKPNPAFIRKVPQEYLDGMKWIEAKEAAEEARRAAEAEAAEADVEARIKSAVAAAVDKVKADLAAAAGSAAPAAATGGGDSISPIDWNSIKPTKVTLFYPGQASFEWVQTGKDHGGARPFTKGGDRCSTCHAKELADMGEKIVTGKKAEPTPIPGKRGHIDVKVQAAHDDTNLYLRFQWPNGKHTPAPFVDGGKMDPDNQVKLAMMIAGTGIERVEQAGCWTTCHHDSRYMPHAPDEAMLEKAKDVLARLTTEPGGGTITKYIKASRTKVEVKGRRKKRRGGWNKLKSEEDIDKLMKAGTFMDIIRFESSGKAENGHVLDSRIMKDEAAIRATGRLEGSTWIVEISKPLNSGKPGDITIEKGKLYTVGFAIHDDFTDARFHHVSLEWKLGLDNDKAEINAIGK